MKNFIGSDREILLDKYRELAPDYIVTGNVVDVIDNSTTRQQFSIMFKKDDKVMRLDEAIEELGMPSPDEILSQV